MASITPITEDSLTGSKVIKYPNPFFDLSANYVPKNIKSLFKYCRDFFNTSTFLKNVVTKLSTYPITDVLYREQLSQDAKKEYNILLKDKLKIKSTLVEIGLDYFTYGNAFITTMVTEKRFLKCTSCKHTDTIENIPYQFRNYEFYIKKCQKCSSMNIKAEIVDEPLNSTSNFRLVRLNPENIDIDYNPLTGSAIYYYSIPNKIKAQIISSNAAILKDIPAVFLQSMKMNKQIILNSSNLYHFKYPSLAEEDMGWGKPMILPAIREIYYLQTLRRGNEAIANEHIVPKKAIFPAANSSIDPFSAMNMGEWVHKMEDQVKKWKIDPNYIGIFPIPIGYQELGGNAKMLMVTPEMKFLEETILNSLGVPLEFIKGGASWTGSSVSLRIVENQFITYREMLSDFLNYFLIPKLSKTFKLPEVTVQFKKFKMSDDSESKQLYTRLAETGKISDGTLLDEFGIDSVIENEKIVQAADAARNNEILNSEARALAQGKGEIILAEYQARAQDLMASMPTRIKVEKFHDELSEELNGIEGDPFQTIERFAIQFLVMPSEQRDTQLSTLARKTPITYSLVLERMQTLTVPPTEGQEVKGVNQKLGYNAPPGQEAPNTKRPEEKKPEAIKTKSNKTVGKKTGEA